VEDGALRKQGTSLENAVGILISAQVSSRRFDLLLVYVDVALLFVDSLSISACSITAADLRMAKLFLSAPQTSLAARFALVFFTYLFMLVINFL
jgi:hypothetical protein